jgi:hypothetical protein
MRQFFLLAATTTILVLAGCAGTSSTPGNPTTSGTTPQTVAQQINARWGLITAGINLGMLEDKTPTTTQARVTAAEAAIEPQIAACASGTSTTCLPQVQAAIVSFLNGLVLGPKGQAELAVGAALIQTLVPGITA